VVFRLQQYLQLYGKGQQVSRARRKKHERNCSSRPAGGTGTTHSAVATSDTVNFVDGHFGVRGHVRALELVTRPHLSAESGPAVAGSPHPQKLPLVRKRTRTFVHLFYSYKTVTAKGAGMNRAFSAGGLALHEYLAIRGRGAQEHEWTLKTDGAISQESIIARLFGFSTFVRYSRIEPQFRILRWKRERR
jgi:hypothetical protein